MDSFQLKKTKQNKTSFYFLFLFHQKYWIQVQNTHFTNNIDSYFKRRDTLKLIPIKETWSGALWTEMMGKKLYLKVCSAKDRAGGGQEYSCAQQRGRKRASKITVAITLALGFVFQGFAFWKNWQVSSKFYNWGEILSMWLPEDSFPREILFFFFSWCHPGQNWLLQVMNILNPW